MHHACTMEICTKSKYIILYNFNVKLPHFSSDISLLSVLEEPHQVKEVMGILTKIRLLYYTHTGACIQQCLTNAEVSQPLLTNSNIHMQLGLQ